MGKNRHFLSRLGSLCRNRTDHSRLWTVLIILVTLIYKLQSIIQGISGLCRILSRHRIVKIADGIGQIDLHIVGCTAVDRNGDRSIVVGYSSGTVFPVLYQRRCGGNGHAFGCVVEYCTFSILLKSYCPCGIAVIVYCGYPGNLVIISVIVRPGFGWCGHIPYCGNGDFLANTTSLKQLLHKLIRYCFSIQDTVADTNILFYIFQ